jgi:hypothetical protein
MILLPFSGNLTNEFYNFLLEDPYSASFFKTEEAMKKRREIIISWF